MNRRTFIAGAAALGPTAAVLKAAAPLKSWEMVAGLPYIKFIPYQTDLMPPLWSPLDWVKLDAYLKAEERRLRERDNAIFP